MNKNRFEDKIKIETRNENEGKELRNLIRKYEDIFEYDEPKITKVDIVQHEMRIKEGVEPIKQIPYRQTEEKMKFIDEYIKESLKLGIIRESKNPWRLPVTLAGKKSGKYRFCVDYRKVNEVTVEDSYPLPRMDELLHKYRNANYFTSMDLASGYYQVEMKEEDKEITAFGCHRGLFEYNVMPFGLMDAPETFQRMMDDILREYIDQEFVVVYLDDIMIYSRTFDEHIEHLEKVLKKLRSMKLIVKLKKCKFGQEEVEFLGHIVGSNGLRPSESKIESIKNIREPKNITEIRTFIGLCSYYRKFVEGFSNIVKPLTALIKKNVKFEWGKEQQDAFEEMKEKLISYPILGQPEFEREFILITDASGKGLGAILAQKDEQGNENVIEYASRSLRGSEINYTVTELECLAVVWGVEHFRKYLIGRKFTVVTDHSALKILRKPNDAKGIRARWEMRLMPFNFEIVHRPGKENKNADALSRLIENKETKEPTRVIICGVDGVGKSTVVDNLLKEWKKWGVSVRFNTFKRRREDNKKFRVPSIETEWEFRKEVVEQINRRMFEYDNEEIIILDKSPYCEYFYQKTKSFDRGLIDEKGNEKLNEEIFKYKDVIDNAIVIFLENDECWNNYIGWERKKNYQGSYNTLNRKEYMDMVKMFREHQYVYDDVKKHKRIKIKNDDVSWIKVFKAIENFRRKEIHEVKWIAEEEVKPQLEAINKRIDAFYQDFIKLDREIEKRLLNPLVKIENKVNNMEYKENQIIRRIKKLEDEMDYEIKPEISELGERQKKLIDLVKELMNKLLTNREKSLRNNEQKVKCLEIKNVGIKEKQLEEIWKEIENIKLKVKRIRDIEKDGSKLDERIIDRIQEIADYVEHLKEKIVEIMEEQLELRNALIKVYDGFRLIVK